MECADHLMSHAPLLGIRECAASRKLRRLSDSSLSKIGPWASQMMSSIDLVSDVTSVSSVHSVDEDKSKMFETCLSPLPIHLRWYESPLGTCCSGDLSVAQGRCEEHDARDKIRLYHDMMRNDSIEFGYYHVREPTLQGLKIAERVFASNAGNIDQVARIDELEKNVASGKFIIAVFESIIQVSPRRHTQRLADLIEAYIVFLYMQLTSCELISALRICAMFIYSSFILVE